MQTATLDDFADLSGWMPVASGLATLAIRADRGPDGPAMRMDFDFKGSGGFVVARKPLRFTVPETYVLTMDLRGEGPANKLEIKLVDATGKNVWWYHRDAFELPRPWQPLRIRSNEVEFAWGPSAGQPLGQTSALEIALAAGPGGKGSLWISNLRIEDRTYRQTPLATASSALDGHLATSVLDGRSDTSWRSGPSKTGEWLLLDFQEPRELGGLVVTWVGGASAVAFDVECSDDGTTWKTVHSSRQAGALRSYLYLPGAAARYLRLRLLEAAGPMGFGIVGVEVQPFEFSRSIEAFFEHVARHEPAGAYPRYLAREQSYWTPVGLPDGNACALMNEEGMVEVDHGGFSIEPFWLIDGRLVTWADATRTQRLEREYLPIPSSVWEVDGMTLSTAACAVRDRGAALLVIRYRAENSGTAARSVRLFAALRPFQVTPPWQAFRGLGGVARISRIEMEGRAVRVNGEKVVAALGGPVRFGAAAFEQGAITDWLRAGEVPPHASVDDEFGFASGAFRYDLHVGAGATSEAFLVVPFGADTAAARQILTGLVSSGRAAELYARAIEEWTARLGSAGFPDAPSARTHFDALRTAIGHVLSCRNGAALQPGPRRYTRAWIRDGAIMAAALLRAGCTQEAAEFVRWYAPFQAPDGNVPCAVDEKGADWLVEHDSHGELIFAVMDCYRFTGDRAFLAEMWPSVLRAVEFIATLRASRMTGEYETGDKRAMRGLLPESASHEGYLAHPVHAYWDDLWALRGLRDAAAMAALVGDEPRSRTIAESARELRAALRQSMERTIVDRAIAYVPGSVEWADFDPTATAIAISLLDATEDLPREALEATLREYLAGFRRRVAGETDWANYTPYEIRIVGALVQLGWRDEAHELLDFFLSDRRPLAWNQWPEIAWRNPRSPGHLGDVPHAWIGAEYALAVRSMLAFEREADRTLVLAAGIPQRWLENGSVIAVERLPTSFGRLRYSLSRLRDGAFRVSIPEPLTVPPRRIVVRPPVTSPIRAVTVDGSPVDTFDGASVEIEACPAEIVVKC